MEDIKFGEGVSLFILTSWIFCIFKQKFSLKSYLVQFFLLQLDYFLFFFFRAKWHICSIFSVTPMELKSNYNWRNLKWPAGSWEVHVIRHYWRLMQCCSEKWLRKRSFRRKCKIISCIRFCFFYHWTFLLERTINRRCSLKDLVNQT